MYLILERPLLLPTQLAPSHFHLYKWQTRESQTQFAKESQSLLTHRSPKRPKTVLSGGHLREMTWWSQTNFFRDHLYHCYGLYSLLVPWVLPCWHPWVLPCHLDTLGVQCTLNILVPLIYQQFRSDFIIAALTRPWWANSVLMTEYEYEYYSVSQKWPNTNTNIIRFPKNDRIRIWILFGFPKMTEYEYEYYSDTQKWPNTHTNIILLTNNDWIQISFGFPKMIEYYIQIQTLLSFPNVLSLTRWC